jgi:hypothetical protein
MTASKRHATTFNFVSFSTSSFSLLPQGPGKGILRKGSFSTKETGPEPPYPRKGSTAASGHSGSVPTTDQGFVGWPPKGSTAASEHAERGMTLGTFDT